MPKVTCYATKKPVPLEDACRGDYIRDEIIKLIQNDFPNFSHDSYICVEKLNYYRQQYLTNLVAAEVTDLSELEKEVVKAITSHQILSENIESELEAKLTLSQKLADKVASFGGSWRFISFFFVFIMGWLSINLWIIATKPFDPYPFILLNLILSCVAAIQAPIIMMSQNRLEEKDRKRGENDYKINLKAELEIRLVHEKINHLITHQSKKMIEIQQLQMDYLEDILKHIEKKPTDT